MLKKIIVASAIIAGGFACGSKGQYTCKCDIPKNTYTKGNTTSVSYDDQTTIVFTEVKKSDADLFCRQQSTKVTAVYTTTSSNFNNGDFTSTIENVTSVTETKCSIVE